MNRQQIFIGMLVLALLVVAVVVGLTVRLNARGEAYAQEPDPQTWTSAHAVPAGIVASTPLSTSFTYQGQLKLNGDPVNSTCDFQFRLYDAASQGNQVGITQTESITVTDGLFTVNLDFGNVFTGTARWLGIRVMCADLGDTEYTDLGRQELTATPYALYALGAPWSGLTGVPAGFADSSDGVEYQNVIVVAKSGGDFTSILAALDSITGTETNRYLVWVAPGTYTETVTMEGHVAVVGAGELLTKITYGGSALDDTGAVVGADNAELRFLTVENTGGNAYAIAMYNNGASPRLTHVTASASGGADNRGVYNYSSSSPTMTDVTATASGGNTSRGVHNNSSSPTMTDVTATASGGTYNYGVYNAYFSPTMTGVTASASGGTTSFGVYNNSSSPAIQNSVLSASGGTNNYGIYNYAPSGTYTVTVNNCQVTGSSNTIHNDAEFTTLVGASLLNGGGVVTGTGTITCAGVYDENYAWSDGTCP